MLKNDYVDDNDNVTDSYRADLANNALAPLPLDLQPIAEGVHTLIQGVFDERVLDDMIDNGNKTKIFENELNENFYKKEFQTLWGYINHKYAYAVDFDTTELIQKAIMHIDENLFVSQLQYTVSTGEQKSDMEATAIDRGDAFKAAKTHTETLNHSEISQVKYDLIGKVAEGTILTRRTAAAILSGISPAKLAMFKYNPEEFINKTVSEYMKLMDAAPLLKAQGLDETYRLLADFNGVVLAGHSSRLGVQFVTWDWDYERTGVSQGHYMSNHYEAAKKDFAVRSGLVWKQQFFSPEHLTEIYRCVQDTLVHLYNLTYDREKCLGKIQEQITNLVPDLQQRIAQAQPQEESAFTEPTM